MAAVELVVSIVLCVPDVVGSFLQVRRALLDGMSVEPVEAGLVDHVDNGLCGMADGQRRVGGRHLSVGLHREHGAEVYAFLRVARCVPGHCQLAVATFHLMGCLCGQADAAVNVALESYGYQLVRMGCEVFALDGFAVAYIAVLYDGGVKAESAVIAADQSQSQVFDVERAQGLEVLRVGTLYVQL